jgi:hypothetical protein
VQGPIGPSTAYHEHSAFNTGGTPLPDNNVTTFHTLDLPAGSYFAIGTVTVRNDSTTVDDGAFCEVVPSAPPSGGFHTAIESTATAELAELSSSTAFTLPDAGTVLLRCGGQIVGGAMVLNQSSLTAIKVGEVVQP